MRSGPRRVWVNQRRPETPRGTLLAEPASHPGSPGPQWPEPSSAVGSRGDPARWPHSPAAPLGVPHSLPGKSKHWQALHSCQNVSGLSLWAVEDDSFCGDIILQFLPGLPCPLPARLSPFRPRAEFGSPSLPSSFSSSTTSWTAPSSDSGWSGPLLLVPTVPGLLCHRPPCPGWSPPGPLLRMGAQERMTKSLPFSAAQFPHLWKVAEARKRRVPSAKQTQRGPCSFESLGPDRRQRLAEHRSQRGLLTHLG